MTTQALVSILIPVYNARPWISQAIESALGQTWPRIEIIVLDDGSTDGSWEAMTPWAAKVRIERSLENRGQNASRNHLNSLCQGDWLVYLDADDELLPDTVEKKMEFSGLADCVYGTMDVQYYRDQTLLTSQTVRASQYADPLKAAFEWKYPNTSSVMLRRSALQEVGGWNEDVHNCTDYELYFRMLLRGMRFVAAPHSVTVYRQWSTHQAVYQNSVRKTTTRLQVMWAAVAVLEREGKLTSDLRESFSNAALSVIRSLHPIDAARAAAEHQKLRGWHPAFLPSRSLFPGHYCLAYELLGFRAAELLAKVTRWLRPKPSPGLYLHPQAQVTTNELRHLRHDAPEKKP